MAWNREQHEKELADAITAKDLDKIEELSDAAVEHDRDVAEKTGEIFWAHKNKWSTG
ncbi:hypothetical protein LZ318_30870 [Saccharopolyspora indica]|uniref:hypothetical protein n=1 Tax=Saccharopolyspora indica TaxID=1229659 RepID=UPI0022EA93A3|nr:hypothetical protein [Saccharopolyspora indica]MDA3644364.1 hypothetical protein [Saccharopolyspora indica]